MCWSRKISFYTYNLGSQTSHFGRVWCPAPGLLGVDFFRNFHCLLLLHIPCLCWTTCCRRVFFVFFSVAFLGRGYPDELCLLPELLHSWALWEGVVVLKVKYFSLGGCGSPAITRISYRQINGSNDVMLCVPLGGTVLCLPIKWLKAKTNWVHPGRLGILMFGRVCWFWTENKRQLTEVALTELSYLL